MKSPVVCTVRSAAASEMMQVRKTRERPLQLSLHYDRYCSSHSSRKPMLNTSCEEKLKSNLILGKCAHANYALNVCVHVSCNFEWGSVNCELTRWEHRAITSSHSPMVCLSLVPGPTMFLFPLTIILYATLLWDNVGAKPES